MKLIVFVMVLFLANLSQADSECSLNIAFIKSLSCPYQTLDVTGEKITRSVKYALPNGQPPAQGWPAVFIYQGSFFPVEFSRIDGTPYGGFNEARLIQSLLDHGFAVIAPPAINESVWMTNLIGSSYESSEDDIFIQHLLDQVGRGDLGPINSKQLFAAGFSSGGYNVSRMAVSFPGIFKALAIESASYATCGGSLCHIPEKLPDNHPPTLFLHGAADLIVPMSTMQEYYLRLKQTGVPTSCIIDKTAGHQWIAQAPEAITKWFLSTMSSPTSEHTP